MTTFRTSRELSASPDAVFAAIADPSRLARWWGPAGFTNTFDHFEFRPGGRWLFTMHGPDGQSYPNESVFVSIVPGRSLRLRHVGQPVFDLQIDLDGVRTSAGGGTLVRWEQVFDDAAFGESVRHIIEPSNEQNLDRLTAEVLGAPVGLVGP